MKYEFVPTLGEQIVKPSEEEELKKSATEKDAPAKKEAPAKKGGDK
jgi:hypothetical protein